MPTVLRKNGFRFFFYSNEGREPPHIHVAGRGGEAKIWLNPIEIVGVYRLNFKDQQEVLSIARENVKLILREWSKWHDPIRTKN